MKKILLLLMLFCSATVFAEVNFVKNNRGKYYEVHKNRDGSYTYFFIPHMDLPISVSGLKSDKAILGFFGIRGNRKGAVILKKALEEGKVDATDPLVFFTVDIRTVDKLSMRYGTPPQGGMPGGSIYHTDLLWLIEEAKRSGRYIDHAKK